MPPYRHRAGTTKGAEMDMTEADRAKLAELQRGIDESSPAYLDAARLVAHAALAFQGEPIRQMLVDELQHRYDARGYRLANAALDAIRMCEPGGAMSAEERLSRVQWTLYRAIRDTAADMAHDLRGDRDPACAVLGIEIEADEGDMETYDDRGEPVSIGRM